MKGIDYLFRPASIAVVGATPDESKPGGRCIRFLRQFGYRGEVFPVNPKYETILDLPAFAGLDALPGPAELVVLLVAAKAVPDYLRQAAAAGARAVVVCASGFAEAGPEGRALQDEVAAIAAETGLAVVGPNSLGVIDLHSRVTATFTTGLQAEGEPLVGPVAFLSQSGAMGAIVMSMARSDGLGFGKIVSSGNEAVLDFTDFVDYFADDPQTELVLGYVEGLRRGREFVHAARRARAAGKLVCVLKVGKSNAGVKAARSHTGALVGSAQVYDAAFRRAGVLEVGDTRELLDLALARPGRNRAAGPRVGIVSMSGGAAVLMSDQCSAAGLTIGTLAQSTQAALSRVLPSFAGTDNPIDYGPVYGDPEAIRACVDAVLGDPGIDIGLVFIGASPRLAGVIEEPLAAVRARHAKPVIVAWLGGPAQGITRLRELGIPAYDQTGRAVAVVAHLVGAGVEPGAFADETVADDARGQATRERLAELLRRGRSTLTEREVKELLAPYAIPTVREALATSAEEADRLAREIAAPVAVKAEAPELLHKSDSGAVRLAVWPDEAGTAWEEVVAAAAAVVGRAGVRGAVIQPMARPGLELLVGLRYDAQFGPVVSAGLGGVTSEVLGDVATELAPVDHATARAMLGRLRSAPLLGRFRGAPARDVAALADVIVGISQFATEAGPLVAELDLNPVLVHAEGEGCTVVDGAAVIQAAPVSPLLAATAVTGIAAAS